MKLLKMDQINITDNHCLLWGNEILPESLNKKIFCSCTQLYQRFKPV